jgi:hypothetical protein
MGTYCTPVTSHGSRRRVSWNLCNPWFENTVWDLMVINDNRNRLKPFPSSCAHCVGRSSYYNTAGLDVIMIPHYFDWLVTRDRVCLGPAVRYVITEPFTIGVCSPIQVDQAQREHRANITPCELIDDYGLLQQVYVVLMHLLAESRVEYVSKNRL